jgi:hypothetical protein
MNYFRHIIIKTLIITAYGTIVASQQPMAQKTMPSSSTQTNLVLQTSAQPIIPRLPIEQCNNPVSPHHGKRRNALADIHKPLNKEEKAVFKK